MEGLPGFPSELKIVGFLIIQIHQGLLKGQATTMTSADVKGSIYAWKKCWEIAIAQSVSRRTTTSLWNSEFGRWRQARAELLHCSSTTPLMTFVFCISRCKSLSTQEWKILVISEEELWTSEEELNIRGIVGVCLGGSSASTSLKSHAPASDANSAQHGMESFMTRCTDLVVRTNHPRRSNFSWCQVGKNSRRTRKTHSRKGIAIDDSSTFHNWWRNLTTLP